MCFRIATICTSKLNDFLPQFTNFRNALFQLFQHSARSQTATVEIAGNLIEVVSNASGLRSQMLNVNREELVDINDVEIKKDLSQRERMVDFVSQIKNPYCYLDRGMVVKISFAGENRLEDTLKRCARTHRK